jgi:hypothetical protein
VSHYAEKVHQMSAMESLSLEANALDGPADLFVRLRQLARQSPGQVATVSPDRTANYRKLWSRVERATARLQGEWAVSAGQYVVYEGPPHADALVLWLALCRLGACLLPLEHIPLRPNGDALAAAHASPGALQMAGAATRAMLWLHADDFLPSITAARIAMHPLSSLIMQPCPFQPVVRHEDGRLDCIEFLAEPTMPGHRPRRSSLRELMSQYHEPPTGLDLAAPTIALDQGAFKEHVLGPILLPALMAGRCLLFGAGSLPDAQPATAALR